MRNFGKIGLGILVSLIAATGSASASCSNSNLNGAYGFIVRGPADPSNNPVATVGLFTADGSGHLSSGSFTQSNNGTVATATFTGTYNIDAGNCTGALTTTDSNSVTRHYYVVLTGAKKDTMDLIETDSGLTVSGSARPQGVGICGLTGKSAVFAEHLNGMAGGETPEAVVGRLGIDGNGNISGGVDELSAGGTAFPRAHTTGTYTANSNCTGTAAISLNNATYNFNYVLVDAGRQYLVIETDINTTIAGSFTIE